MKKVSLLSFLFLLFAFAKAQDISIFQATLKQGSTNNRVKAVIRPGQDVSSFITNWEFTFTVPTSVGPAPTVTVTNNPYSAGVSYTVHLDQDANFYYYSLEGNPTGSNQVFSFTNATEYDAVEINFQIGTSPAPTSTVRLVQVPQGSINGRAYTNFYLEFAGNDYTNRAAQFYGPSATNDGQYNNGNSSVPLAGVSLPTKFVSFLAAKENNDAQLTWTVDNEEDNDHFELERSTDGRAFTKFATVPAAKNGHSSNSYNFTDFNFSRNGSKVTYYRVKQYEYSGASEYSQVRNLQLEAKDFKLSLFPNPATSQTRLIFNIEQPGKGAIVVRDLHGREVQVINQTWVKGLNQQTINVQGLAAGEYNISIVGENINQTVPLRKVN